MRGLTTQPEQSKQPEEPARPAKPAKPAQVAQAAQTANPAHRANKREPKPEPTQQELFEYIRGKLLTLSPTDGFNDNLEVTFDPATSTLSITQPDGRCDIFVNALDTSSAIWEVMDLSDSSHTRGDLLRLTMTSSSGKKARTCYDNQNQVDKSISANRVRLVFAQNKANAVPDFTYNMTTAIKKLVVASGGAPEKKIFLGVFQYLLIGASNHPTPAEKAETRRRWGTHGLALSERILARRVAHSPPPASQEAGWADCG